MSNAHAGWVPQSDSLMVLPEAFLGVPSNHWQKKPSTVEVVRFKNSQQEATLEMQQRPDLGNQNVVGGSRIVSYTCVGGTVKQRGQNKLSKEKPWGDIPSIIASKMRNKKSFSHSPHASICTAFIVDIH